METKLSAEKKLREMVSDRIQRRYFWLAVETIDVLSDLLNFLVVVVSGVGIGSAQFIIFLTIALMSCTTGFYGVFMRFRMIPGYSKILEGDKETMEVYAKGICHTSDMSKITLENLLIRLDMLPMDLTVIELALRGMLLEDIPSTIVNLGFVISEGKIGLGAVSLVPLFAALISVFLTGRKSGLVGKRTEIVEVKRDIEGALEKEEALGVGGEGIRKKLSGKLCTVVFGKESKATKRGEEELLKRSSSKRLEASISGSSKKIGELLAAVVPEGRGA